MSLRALTVDDSNMLHTSRFAPLRTFAGCMDRVKDLIDYLREEPEEQAWATAGSKKDKSQDKRASAFGNSIKPQTMLEKFYSEGKILPGHLDER